MSAGVVLCVLPLELDPGRLGRVTTSGVLGVEAACAGVRAEPTEDRDAKEAADTIASG